MKKVIFGERLELPTETVEPKVFVKYRRQVDLSNNIQQRTLSHTNNAVSQSFTSTTASIKTKNSVKALGDDEIRLEYYQPIKSKQITAQALILTNLGPIHIELFCGKAPKTCENFIELAR